MLRTLPMRRVTIQVLAEDARDAALALAETAAFAPDASAELDASLPLDPAVTYRRTLTEARARLHKILAESPPLSVPVQPPVRSVPEPELERLNQWLGELWARCSQRLEALRELHERLSRSEQLLVTLENFLSLDVDLDRFHRDGGLLDLRIGTIPEADENRLSEALALAGFALHAFLRTRGRSHVVVAGPRGTASGLESLLRAAGWQSLSIPAEFHRRPAEVRRDLQSRMAGLQDRGRQLRAEIDDLCRESAESLAHARASLAAAASYAGLGEGMRGRGGLTVITGWVPERDLGRLEAHLFGSLPERVVIASRPPREGERVPSVLAHGRLLGPFVTLVKGYGVPRYGEFDPTLLLALSFVIMFGMMFGDVGHGGVIALAGLVMHRRLAGFTTFAVAAGLSSMTFGLLYGSVFGSEHWLRPLWLAPMQDPVRLLRLALFWGAGFVLVATALGAYNRFREGARLQALCDGDGVAGLVLFMSLFYAGLSWFDAGQTDQTALLFAGAALLLILVYQWGQSAGPVAERGMVVLVRTLETLLQYLAGTLSFLRVAAFSLNHVALAFAVFSLAGTLQGAGQWAILILGNLFIIVLEGAIVGIQVMRLEYYEGLSRFFRGDGREFRPLRLDRGAAVPRE